MPLEIDEPEPVKVYPSLKVYPTVKRFPSHNKAITPIGGYNGGYSRGYNSAPARLSRRLMMKGRFRPSARAQARPRSGRPKYHNFVHTYHTPQTVPQTAYVRSTKRIRTTSPVYTPTTTWYTPTTTSTTSTTTLVVNQSKIKEIFLELSSLLKSTLFKQNSVEVKSEDKTIKTVEFQLPPKIKMEFTLNESGVIQKICLDRALFDHNIARLLFKRDFAAKLAGLNEPEKTVLSC